MNGFNTNNNMHNNNRKRSRSRSMVRNRDRFPVAVPVAVAPVVSVVSQPLAARVQQPVSMNPLAVAAKELKFACQLAHGSPVALIHKWSDVDELYQSIADCFGIQRRDIIFLTVNDFKVEMKNLFTGTLNFKDMLYAHVRGQPVELTVKKDAPSFGVTITDNGMGNAFIKLINRESTFSRLEPMAMPGQLIEAFNGECMLGKRHYQVARVLKSIKQGDECTIRLICTKTASEPMKAPKKIGGGGGMDLAKGTIRFKSDGGFAVEGIQEQIIQAEMCAKLNEVFDAYLGVEDDQLAMRIWEIASKCEKLYELSEALKNSELSSFGFPDGLVFDMWGIIGDLKREQQQQQASNVPVPVEKNSSRQTAMSLFH